jgi:hypothetical protein
MLTCGHVVGGTTVVVPCAGQAFFCQAADCHSTTVVEVVTDLPERDTSGKL